MLSIGYCLKYAIFSQISQSPLVNSPVNFDSNFKVGTELKFENWSSILQPSIKKVRTASNDVIQHLKYSHYLESHDFFLLLKNVKYMGSFALNYSITIYRSISRFLLLLTPKLTKIFQNTIYNNF